MKRLKNCLFVLMLLLSSVAYAQRTVSGKVTNQQTREGLPGVSINVKGSQTTTTSGNDGGFKITVQNDQAVLVFTYVGFAAQEVSVNNNTNLSVVMSAGTNNLDEVVVIGYGQVKRRDLTGSVVSIKSDVITQTPTHNALEAIQGRAAGVDITRSSGSAGSGVNINIRGFKSIANRDDINSRNAPLIIIDGFQGGDLSSLNSNDIESMEILKDASSTAIYGAQGGNGVIIVTTKRGAAGKLKVNYNGFYGVNTFMFPKGRTGEDYLNLRREAWRNSLVNGVPEWQSTADDAKIFTNLPGEYAAYQAGQWVDWVDLVSQQGSTQQSHNISVSSGTEKTKVYLSTGYFKEEGLLRNNDFNRYNLRLNLDHNLGRFAKAGVTSQVTYTNQNIRRDPLGNAISLSPFGEPFDTNGLVKRFPILNDSRVNPLLDERNEFVSQDNLIRTNILAGGYVEITPFKGLSLRSNFSTTFNVSRRGTYNDKTSLAQVNPQTSVASITNGFGRYINWDNILSYTKAVNEHSLTVSAISSYIQSDDEQTIATGTGQVVASQIYYGLGSAGVQRVSSPFSRSNNLAYAGRLSYSFKGRYVLYASGRFDGASRLSDGHKWDFFPASGLAWNISDEKFLENVEPITNLKLRATYGVSGNYNITPYSTQSTLIYSSRMSFGEVSAPAYLFSGTIGNPDVGWEKTATTNIGLDFGLLKNRITGAVDVFSAKTTGILYRRVLPQSTGVTEVVENIASTLNKGLEIAVNTQNIRGRDFRWSSAITFTKTNQKVLDVVNGKDIIAATASERESLLIGRPLLAFYSFVKEGIWQQNEAAEAATFKYGSATGNTFKPGDIKLRDISGPSGKPDGIIDATYDRAFLGSSVPKWIGGLQNTFNYKNFDLGVFLFFRYGQMIDAEFLGRYNPAGTGNSPAFIDYWTPENPTNDFPRPVKNGQLINYAGYQTLNFIDGSFFKIKNITLGYTLPKSISNKIASDNIRFYATGSNVLTVAKSQLVKDYDPERGGAESSPIGRQFVFGVNVGF